MWHTLLWALRLRKQNEEKSWLFVFNWGTWITQGIVSPPTETCPHSSHSSITPAGHKLSTVVQTFYSSCGYRIFIPSFHQTLLILCELVHWLFKVLFGFSSEWLVMKSTFSSTLDEVEFPSADKLYFFAHPFFNLWFVDAQQSFTDVTVLDSFIYLEWMQDCIDLQCVTNPTRHLETSEWLDRWGHSFMFWGIQ